MSKNVKIVLNWKGIRQMLKSQEVQDYTTELAEGIKNRAGGEGYEVITKETKTRCYSEIDVTTWDAYHHEQKNNTLLKSLR